jgi:hypothetical protein
VLVLFNKVNAAASRRINLKRCLPSAKSDGELVSFQAWGKAAPAMDNRGWPLIIYIGAFFEKMLGCQWQKAFFGSCFLVPTRVD